jgi:hypothetical protein
VQQLPSSLSAIHCLLRYRRTTPRSCDLVRSSHLRLAKPTAFPTSSTLLSWPTLALCPDTLPTTNCTPARPRARTRSACRLCCSPLNFQPVFGPPTPRSYLRLACRALLLGRRPRKPQAGCAPVSPADAAGAPRSNVSIMVLGPSAGHVSTEARIANILLLPRSDRGGAKVVSLPNRSCRRTQTGGQSSAKVYKASKEPRLD